MPKSDVRKRIILAAGEVFAEKGYQAATVRQICQDAGVNLAAVNYYFGDKERLYIETVRFAHRPDDEPDELPEWPEGTPTEAKLRDFIRGLLTRMMGQRAPWQRQLMFREMLSPTVACRELVRTYIRARFDQLRQILSEVLPPETPVHQRHQIAFSIIGQVLHHHVAGEVVTLLVGEEEREAHYGLEELADHITEFSVAALGLGPPLSEAKDAISSHHVV
jgi:AcrR family transcriptional regulator